MGCLRISHPTINWYAATTSSSPAWRSSRSKLYSMLCAPEILRAYALHSVGTIVIFSTLVGYLMSWTGRTRPWMWAGGVVNTIANGLLIMLDGTHPRAVEYVFLALSGAGVGFIAQTNTVSAQSKVAKELLASVTTMTMWSKSLGGIVGIAMQGSIINNVFQKNMLADPAAAPVRPRAPFAHGCC